MTVYFNPTDDDSRFPLAYDDQQGQVGTALTGNTQWSLNTYRDTGLIVPFLRRDQSDFINLIFQFSHRKQLGTVLASLHAHVIGMAASAGNVFWSWAYTWQNVGSIIPAIGSWVTGTTTSPIAAADQYKMLLLDIFTGIAAPASEDYSSHLFVKLSRIGTNISDTYQGNAGTGVASENLAIAYVDCHFPMDRPGSPTGA